MLSRTTRAWGALVMALAVLAMLPLSLLVAGPALAEDSDLDQSIDRGQETAKGRAVLSSGHVDIGGRLAGGTLELQVHDDTVRPSVWRELDDVVLQVPDAALLTVPDREDYAFLGQEPGAQVHVLPQTQDPELVWVGWNTQDPELMARANLGATLSLYGVQGPGDLVVYLQSGNLTEPEPLWSSTSKEAKQDLAKQDLFVEVNTHTHANWVFSEPGVYLVDFEMSAELKDGSTVSDRGVLRFAVGDETATDDAFSAEYDAAAAPAGSGDDAAAAEDAPEQDEEGSTTRIVVIAAGALAVLVALVWALSARRNRRIRSQALEDRR